MEIDFRGIPFILVGIPLISLVLIVFWGWFCRNSEAARTSAAVSLLGVVPVVTFLTVELRWGEIDDSPAAGIPYYAALLEIFWIIVGGLVLILLFQEWASDFFGRRRLKKELKNFE